MKVLHLSTAITWRGGEQQLMYLWDGLQHKGVEQMVFCPEGSEVSHRLAVQNQAAVTTFAKKMSIDLIAAFKLYRLCRRFKPDIMHTHDANAHTLAFLSALIYGNSTPLIVSRRVDFVADKNLLSKYKYNHSRIKAIACVSESIRQIMIPIIRKPEKLKVIYSGISKKRFPFNKPTGKLRNLLGLSSDMFIIGTTSALSPHKDFFTFVDIASKLCPRYDKMQFVIIGSGSQESVIKRYIEEKQLEKRVILTGFRTDIPELLPDFDVFLITSISEGLGTSILDAFACGVPVVATRTGGIPEIVIHKETGLLAEVGDSSGLAENIISIYKSAELREKVKDGAKQMLHAFSNENMVENTLRIYRESIN